MAGMGRGGDATVPAWLAPGAPPAATLQHPDGAALPPDVEEAARAALLGEQDAAMRAALAPQQHSGQKRAFDDRDGPAQHPEDPAALKVLLCILPLALSSCVGLHIRICERISYQKYQPSSRRSGS